MRRATRFAVVSLAAVAAIALFLPAGVAVSSEIQQVIVTNFPKIFPVEGTVAVKGPIRQALLVPFTEVTVPPVALQDSTRWIDVGLLESDGFSHVVLSLSGQIKGEVLKTASVGAVLLPDEEPVIRAFREKGELQFGLEVVASGVSPAGPYFASGQPRYQVGFPRYRVFLYNTSEKAVLVNLYAYLTN